MIPRAAMMLVLMEVMALASSEWIKVRKDGNGFVLNHSGAPFVPCGFNYDRDYRIVFSISTEPQPRSCDLFPIPKLISRIWNISIDCRYSDRVAAT